MSARGFLGAGDLYINRYIGGVLQGLKGPFEAKKFEIKPNVELKEMTSKGRGTYGQVVETVAIPQPFELTVELAETNKEGLALAMFGTVAVLTQTSGTLTDEVVIAKHDVWVPLTKAKWTGDPTVTNSAASVTYVQGTDYIVNKQMGWFKALSTGAITDGQSLKVDTAYAAITGSEIKGATETQIRAQFVLDGVNFVDGAPYKVTVYEAVIAADSAFDFLADDFNTLSLPGKMKTPSGFTEPFLVQLRDL